MRLTLTASLLVLTLSFHAPSSIAEQRWIGAVDSDLLAGTAWHHRALEHGLDPWLLYAITLEESNHYDPRTRKLYPWRWVIHHDYELTYHENEADARAHIDYLESQGIRNYDIGPLQINRHWHGDKVEDLYELLTIHRSVDIAARLLAENRSLTPDDKSVWVGRYRSWQPKLAQAYAKRIFHIRKQLPQGERYAGYGEPLWVRR